MSQKKTPFFILRDWNAKGGTEDKPGVTGKFGLRVQNEAKVESFDKRMHWSQQTPFSNNIRDDYIWTTTRWSISKLG